jgi:prepilin-type N-terminal cleavage/methylation domain-containing protein
MNPQPAQGLLLSTRSGSSVPGHLRRGQGGLTLIELLISVAIVSILAMVGIPTYTDYTVRSKVISDFVLARELQFLVTQHYILNGTMPQSNAELGLPVGREIQGQWLRSARVQPNPEAGTIRLVYDNLNKLQVLGGQNRINLVPELVGGTIVWDCTKGNMEDRYRPPNCR